MARLLAERLEEEGESAGAEVSVAGLLEEWVPYGVARSVLDLTTKSEYDLLVLEFLADRRLTVLGDPAVAEAAGEELETPEPGLGVLEGHADVPLRLDLPTISGGYRGSDVQPGSAVEGGTVPDAAGEEESEAPEAVEAWDPTGGVEARPTLDAGGESSPDSHQPEQASRSKQPDRSGSSVDIGPGPRGGGSDAGEREAGADNTDCRSCGEALPVDVDVPVRFCPSCGAARPERACPECGARLRPEWSYCPACGTHASPSGGVPGTGPDGGEAGDREPE